MPQDLIRIVIWFKFSCDAFKWCACVMHQVLYDRTLPFFHSCLVGIQQCDVTGIGFMDEPLILAKEA